MQCPCSSGKEFENCCQKIHQNLSSATNPEEVMRARYSAFATQEIPFLKESTHPSKRDQFEEEDISNWAHSAEWLGLEIVNAENIDQNQGSVEFIARYSLKNKIVNHHEIASFSKDQGSWYFVDGKIISDTVKNDGPKIGRNDPCICGSGKKYKKCCLA